MKESHPSQFCLSISATFTAEPLRPVLSFWGGELGANFDVRFAPYNQPVQTLLDPASVFGTNRRGVNVVLVRQRDLAQDESRRQESIAGLMEALRSAIGRLPCPHIFCSEDERLLALATAIDGLHVLAHREIEDLYPVAQKTDPQAEKLGEIPYTEEFFAALGTALARRIAGLTLPPFKAIAVDCDNTLWEGICGEDGPGGVVLDPARQTLHELLLAQRDAGMLLCLVSKNNLVDVRETFRVHPEMTLRWEHFTASRVNWDPKADSLASISQELGLGLDSFIFIDDSAKECAEMDEAAPQVLALPLPPDVAELSHFLRHVWAFDHPVITEADRNRVASYAQAQEFGRAFHGAHTIEDFMAALELHVTIEPVTPERLARVAQLTQRTNQFNFTGQRRSEAEIRKVHECRTVDVSDRFGEYGLVGAMLLDESAEKLTVRGFLLSCRVLGRGVEHRMLRHVGELATSRGLPVVSIQFRDTGRNRPALQFLNSIGASEGDCFRFEAGFLAALRWTPVAGAAENPAPAIPEKPPEHRFVPFERIARTLSTTAQIIAAMRADAPDLEGSMTGLERELAAIWADLLKVSPVQAEDRFFDLGGHSLLAILLLSRIRERFGVELSIDDVYNASLTLRDLAARVEMARLSNVTPDEYESMLAEIEGLTDDEVRALLEA